MKLMDKKTYITLTTVCASALLMSCTSTQQRPSMQERPVMQEAPVVNKEEIAKAKPEPTAAPKQAAPQVAMNDGEARFDSMQQLDGNTQLQAQPKAEPSPSPQAEQAPQQKRELTAEEIEARNQQMEELKQAILERFNQLKEEKMAELGEDVNQEAQQDDTSRLETTLETEAPKTEAERQFLVQQENQLYSEITGLIIDDTLTPFGSRFYHNFYITWQPPKVGIDYNVYLEEQFSPNWGTRLTVRVDDYFIWQQRLQPRSAVIEEAVEKAQGAVYQFLANYEEYQKQLGGSDMAGTGL